MDAAVIIRVVLALTVLAAGIYLGNLAAEKLALGEKTAVDYGTIAPLPTFPAGSSQPLPTLPTSPPGLPPGLPPSPRPSPLASSCKLACAENTGCAAAAFDDKLDVCYLKTSLSARQPTLPGGRTTFLKPVTQMRISPHANTSLPDADDLYVVQSSTASACGHLCHLSGPCAGATYYEDGTRRCKLKRSASTPSAYTGRMSFY